MQKHADRTRKLFEILILGKLVSLFYADEIILVYHDEGSAAINIINLSHRSVFFVSLHICIFLPESFPFF